MSSFDPTKFLGATTTEALVKRPPLPVGDYIADVGEPKARQWNSNKPEAKVKSGVAIDLPLVISKVNNASLADYPADSVTIVPGIMLDLNEGGNIDWSQGKNGGLRRYREALGMNTPGETFSIDQMQGRQIRVSVKHREYEGEFYDEVGAVAKV